MFYVGFGYKSGSELEPECILVLVPLRQKSYNSCGSGSSSATLVFAIKHELLAPLQSLGHQNADIPVANIPVSIIPAALTVCHDLSLLLPFSNLSLSALLLLISLQLPPSLLAVTGVSAVAIVPAVAAFNAVVAVLTGADVPTVLLLLFIAFYCILAVVCVSAVANIPVLLAVLGIQILNRI